MAGFFSKLMEKVIKPEPTMEEKFKDLDPYEDEKPPVLQAPFDSFEFDMNQRIKKEYEWRQAKRKEMREELEKAALEGQQKVEETRVEIVTAEVVKSETTETKGSMKSSAFGKRL